MEAGQILARWRGIGGGMLKTVMLVLLVLVLGVFIYLARSSYTARARASEEFSDSESDPIAHSTPAAQHPASGAQNPQGETTEEGAANVSGVKPPGSDSIVPNPPNGMAFGGSGHFQLYRQGDITWRLNTTTGATCIVFATNEEWKQPRVRRAACPKSGHDD